MADYGPLTPSNRLEWFLMNGGSGGSGGGGELSTAKLAITIPSGGSVYVPFIDLDGECAVGILDDGVYENIDVILYHGTALLLYNGDSLIATIEGDANSQEVGVIVISGDCSIEFSTLG